MKRVFIILLLLYGNDFLCQDDQNNQFKYWNYRDRLKKDFLKVGDEHGESIPYCQYS